MHHLASALRGRSALLWLWAMVAVLSALPGRSAAESQGPGKPGEAVWARAQASTESLSARAARLAGGPDAFGYTFADSNEPIGPEFLFEDISTSGTEVFLSDDSTAYVGIGFDFPFYGDLYTSATISSNGFLSFDEFSGSQCCTGLPIPTGSISPVRGKGPGPTSLIAGWWEDLNPSNGGTIHYLTLGPRGQERFIVQFTDIPPFGGNSNPNTFQFKLFRATGNIEVHYLAAHGTGGDSTFSAGIQDPFGEIGLQYYYGTGDLVTTASEPIAVRYTFSDCDGDGITNIDEITSGSLDCNNDLIPDECQIYTDRFDCDMNGVIDSCDEIADCNDNRIPDSCELATSDCDGNGILDDCEELADCNDNGRPDSLDIRLGALDIEATGLALADGFTSVTAPIAFPYYFTGGDRTDFCGSIITEAEGDRGRLPDWNNIGDGGDDMYDCGNYMYSDYAFDSEVPYTFGELWRGAFGPRSQYATFKFPGLFALLVHNNESSFFGIDGDLGADGDGFAEASQFEITVGAQDYTLLVKRTYEAFDPSVNHIVIIPGCNDAFHEIDPFITDAGAVRGKGGNPLTGTDFHFVGGLADVPEFYYLLVSDYDTSSTSPRGFGPTGTRLDDEVIMQVAEEFILLVQRTDYDVNDNGIPDDCEYDFGDAPLAGYNTLLSDNGAFHSVSVPPVVFLGNSVDVEVDGQPEAAAQGDDLATLDDEDGIQFLSPLIACRGARLAVTANVDGYLSGWFDFNRDGDFDDDMEQVFSTYPITSGTTVLDYFVSCDAGFGNTYARFRFTEEAFTLVPSGDGWGYGPMEGEVEDYTVDIGQFNVSDADGIIGTIFSGVAAGDAAGRGVSGVGDIDGDGYEDFAIGADRADPLGRSNAGATYVVYGSPGIYDADGEVNLSEVATTYGFELVGRKAGDLLGYSVCGAGDINGDGLADLIVGAYGDNDRSATQPNAGAAYILFGRSTRYTGQFDLNFFTAAEGIRILGANGTDWLGLSVSGAGDFNADGFADVLAVASTADNAGQIDVGAAYVLFGTGSGLLGAVGNTIDLLTAGSSAFRFYGPTVDDIGGQRMAASGIGDVNGDGVDDIMVGVRTATSLNNGQAFILYGSTAHNGGQTLSSATLTLSQGTAFTGLLPGDQLATSAAGAGDLNGDGINDIVIGAPRWSRTPPEFESGAAYVVYGASPRVPNVNLSSLNGTNGFAIIGDTRADRFGYSAAGVGDVNGDGLADLLVGGPFAETYPGGNAEGEAYVLYGQPGGFSGPVLDIRAGFNGVRLTGTFRIDQIGLAAAPAGDVNGDGFSDLLVGAHLADANGRDSGAAYLFYGGGDRASQVTYRTRTRAGNAGPRMVGDVGSGAHSVPFSRATIDFAGSQQGPSTETVTRTHSRPFDLFNSASVMWDIASTRTGFSSAKITLNYLESEIAGVDGPALKEARLAIFYRPDSFSSWTKLESVGDFAQRKLWAIAPGLGQFAIAQTNIIPLREVGRFEEGFQLVGGIGGDQAGSTVSGVGDVNGDGYEDFAVGAPFADLITVRGIPVEADTGIAYVVYGGPDRSGTFDLDGIPGAGGCMIHGILAGDRLGHGISGAGDVDGDGYDDLLVTAPYGDRFNGSTPVRNCGITYVLFGSPAGPDGGNPYINPGNGSSNAVAIGGDAGGDSFGYSISGIGDIDGDGLDDLFAGAPTVGSTRDGRAYIIYGRTDWYYYTGLINPVSTLGSTVFLPENPRDALGRSVSGVGDVNGDGINDLMIGAELADSGTTDSGMAYFAAGPIPQGSTISASSLRGFIGAGNLHTGWSLAGAGDVNRDGFNDVVIGEPRHNDGTETRNGAAYILFGSPDFGGNPLRGGPPPRLFLGFLPPFVGVQLVGADAYDYAGYSVAGAGDVNADGFSDFLVGAYGAEVPGGNAEGDTFLVYGTSLFGSISGPVQIADFASLIYRGENALDFSGWSVSAAGDVNADGASDLVIGAPLADPFGNSSAGKAYLVYGYPDEVVITRGAFGAFNEYAGMLSDGYTGLVPIGHLGDKSQTVPFSRAYAGFYDGFRNVQPVRFYEGTQPFNINGALPNLWQFIGTRSGATGGFVGFVFKKDEIPFGSPIELLSVYQSSSQFGPWTPANRTSINMDTGLITADITVGGGDFFCIAPDFSLGGGGR